VTRSIGSELVVAYEPWSMQAKEEFVMRLPRQAPTVSRFATADRFDAAVEPSDCSWLKKIACAGALAACGALCAGGPEACLPCFAGLGATSCVDCL